MKRRILYRTGLITLGGERLHPPPPYKGAGWVAILVEQKRNPPTVYRGREVAIRASSWSTAQRALDLIDACHELLTGTTPQLRVHPIAHTDVEPEWINQEQQAGLQHRVMSTSGFPEAGAIAAKASWKRRWVYAAAQYHFSREIYCVHHMDVQPFRSPHLGISRSPNDHVMFSHAIVSAYSVLENLGLELRASAATPSRIGGKWNPIVLNELEARLKAAGIDVNETLLWLIRGPERRIEKKRAMNVLNPAKWAAGPVKDAEVHITEAIAYASWLRSTVAAHHTKELTPALSPYDVSNVQDLARRLFLESLGFWRSL